MIDKERIIELDRMIESVFKDPDRAIDSEYAELNIDDIGRCYREVFDILQNFTFLEIIHYIIVAKLSYIRRIALYSTIVDMNSNEKGDSGDDWMEGYYK